MKRIYIAILCIVIIVLIAGCASVPVVIEDADVEEDVRAVLEAEEEEPIYTEEPVYTDEPVETEEPIHTEEPASTEEPYMPSTPDEVWGELIEAEGGLVWKTLTDEQQALINYPAFDESKVYWTKGGSSYHAIDWCYTLSNSKKIVSGELEEAKGKGKNDPCSKCVGH